MSKNNPEYNRLYRARKLLEDPDFDRKKNAGKYAKIKADPRLAALRAETVRKYNLKRKYGLTPEGFEKLVLDQGGRCAVCPRELENGGYKTHVDHCHETGKVRGLLCLQCNTALGKLGEDEDTILSLLEYVRKHN